MGKFECRIANPNDFNKRWDYLIEVNAGDEKWKVWRDERLLAFNEGTRIIYYGFLDGEIISEATVAISIDDKYIQNKEELIGNGRVYLKSFRTNQEHQGKGYFSILYKFMENDLKERGYIELTLGVEPCEVKNMMIYFNKGYTNYIKTAYEVYPDGEKVLVNYYMKNLD